MKNGLVLFFVLDLLRICIVAVRLEDYRDDIMLGIVVNSNVD